MAKETLRVANKLKTTDRENRIISGLEIRMDGDGKHKIIAGYSAVFDSETDIGGYFRELILPGAFKNALTHSDIHALYNHNYDIVLGRMKSGTLRLVEDDKGLMVEIDPPDTQDARDLMVKMERGDIDEMSFQFSMRGGVEEWDDSGELPLRTIKEIGELFDVTVCPRGAYPETSCGLRSLEQHRKQNNYSAAKNRIARKIDLDLRDRAESKAK